MNKWYWNKTSDRETKNIICDHMKKTNTYYKVSEIGNGYHIEFKVNKEKKKKLKH